MSGRCGFALEAHCLSARAALCSCLHKSPPSQLCSIQVLRMLRISILPSMQSSRDVSLLTFVTKSNIIING